VGAEENDPMTATLNPSWELSTDDPASTRGQPVLVNRITGLTFGPGDRVKTDPNHGYAKAAHAVARLAETAKLNADGEALVARFVGSVSPRSE
jgi:hypothetical protein